MGPEEVFELVHGHACSPRDAIGAVANMFAAVLGGGPREIVFRVHRECVDELFVHRTIRQRVNDERRDVDATKRRRRR